MGKEQGAKPLVFASHVFGMVLFGAIGWCAADAHRRRFYELTRYVTAA
jgi:hypothetical protein